LDCKEKIIIHQLKEKGKDIVTTIISYCKNKREEGKRPCPSLSLSFSTKSPMIFCLLQVCLEGPKGDWSTKSKDPKKP